MLECRHSPGKRPPGSFSDPAQMLQHRFLTSQPLHHGMQIDGCLTRLADITILAQPPRQRRMPDTKFNRDLSLISASRTASRKNSGAGLFPFPIEYLLVPWLVFSGKAGQVQSISTAARGRRRSSRPVAFRMALETAQPACSS